MARSESERRSIDHEFAGWNSPLMVDDTPDGEPLVTKTYASYENPDIRVVPKIPNPTDDSLSQYIPTTQEVLEIIAEAPVPLQKPTNPEVLGDLTPDCHHEESNAHGLCPPCNELTATQTPLEEHLGLSPRTERLPF